MLMELIGFLSGLLITGLAWGALFRFERLRAIRSVYGGFPTAGSPGNALIWPRR